MTATTTSLLSKLPAPARRTAASRIMLTLLLSLFLVYSFVPLVYLVLSATKSNSELFTRSASASVPIQSLAESERIAARDSGIFMRWMFNSVSIDPRRLGAAILLQRPAMRSPSSSSVGET